MHAWASPAAASSHHTATTLTRANGVNHNTLGTVKEGKWTPQQPCHAPVENPAAEFTPTNKRYRCAGGGRSTAGGLATGGGRGRRQARPDDAAWASLTLLLPLLLLPLVGLAPMPAAGGPLPSLRLTGTWPMHALACRSMTHLRHVEAAPRPGCPPPTVTPQETVTRVGGPLGAWATGRVTGS